MTDASLPLTVPFHTADEIRGHPRFAAARASFLDTALALYEGDPLLNRLLLEASRQIIFNLIVCLSFRYDQADRATWPTIRLLKEEMKAFGLLGDRRIDGLISKLTRVGFLELHPAPGDRRARILTPTAKMIALDHQWLIINYKPLQVMFPAGGYSRIIEGDPVLQRAHRLIALRFASQGSKIMDSNPVMMRFLNRDAGSTILYKLLQLARRDEVRQGLSYVDIASFFGVSRTHVRLLMMEAEEHGDIVIGGGSGREIELQPSLLEAFDRFMADSMSGNDLLFRLAMQQVT